ncbi:MAG: hypothetical protein HQM08_26290 [Candidatus Riflebacteria bacterium]|nr:hypothetical protein [Candidatus Riflebacteria bacterium]
MQKCFCILLGALIFQLAFGGAVFAQTYPPTFNNREIVSETILHPSVYDAYSPTILKDKLWIAGWLKKDTTDKIYLSKLVDGHWQEPAGIKFVNHPDESGRIPGYSINDPTVVYRPDKKWLYMYFTALADEENPGVGGKADGQFLCNRIGFLSSSDDGETWYHHPTMVVDQKNGINDKGGWSPSALINNDKVFIYYHTNESAPQIFRTQVNINGWQPEGTVQVNLRNQDGILFRNSNVYFSNVDVQFDGSVFWMVANTTDLKRIVLFRSNDGMNFKPYDGKMGLLIDTSPQANTYVLTPCIQVLDSTNFNVIFGYGPADRPYEFPGATSLHVWKFKLEGEIPVGSATTTTIMPAEGPGSAPESIGSTDPSVQHDDGSDLGVPGLGLKAPGKPADSTP